MKRDLQWNPTHMSIKILLDFLRDVAIRLKSELSFQMSWIFEKSSTNSWNHFLTVSKSKLRLESLHLNFFKVPDQFHQRWSVLLENFLSLLERILLGSHLEALYSILIRALSVEFRVVDTINNLVSSFLHWLSIIGFSCRGFIFLLSFPLFIAVLLTNGLMFL